MRVSTALLVSLGLTGFGPIAIAQPSTPGPATAAPRAQNATDGPRSPAFEYLGTLRAETGTRTVVENGPQGTRTIVQVVGGRFEGPRLKASVQTPAGDWITNRADEQLPDRRSPYAENRRWCTDSGDLQRHRPDNECGRVPADRTAFRDGRFALRLAHAAAGGWRRRARRNHGEVRHLRAEVGPLHSSHLTVSSPRSAAFTGE